MFRTPEFIIYCTKLVGKEMKKKRGIPLEQRQDVPMVGLVVVLMSTIAVVFVPLGVDQNKEIADDSDFGLLSRHLLSVL